MSVLQAGLTVCVYACVCTCCVCELKLHPVVPSRSHCVSRGDAIFIFLFVTRLAGDNYESMLKIVRN